MAVDNAASILTAHNSAKRDYFWTVKLSAVELKLHPCGWLWQFVMVVAAKSQKSRIHNTYAEAIKYSLKFLSGRPEIAERANKPAAQVGARDVRHFLEVANLAGMEHPEEARILTDLQKFKRLIFEHASEIDFKDEVSESRVGFRGRWAKTRPRQLIVDATSLSAGTNDIPLGAVPFNGAREAAARIEEIVSASIDEVRLACIAELAAGAKARRRLTELKTLPPHGEVHRHFPLVGKDNKNSRRVFGRLNASLEELLHATVRRIAADRLWLPGAPSYHLPLRFEALDALFAPEPRFTSIRAFELEYRADPQEVFAATLLLQTYTGWNFGSMMSIKIDDVELADDLIRIQSFKAKTDDDTPIAYIDIDAPGARQAIELLMWNWRRLVEDGHAAESNRDLYMAGNHGQFGALHPVHRLNVLRKARNLREFSLDSVRTTVLFRESLTVGGLEAARRMAGHKSISTTGRYLDQELARRLSSAANLEFSRRLESEIVYASDERHKRILLAPVIPIGDGASCKDPGKPPPGRSSDPFKCSAQRCHEGDGCPNRIVYVDALRIEEVVLTKAHYTARWRALLDANADHFERIVAPAMAFNEALYLALRRGPYSHLLTQTHERVQARS